MSGNEGIDLKVPSYEMFEELKNLGLGLVQPNSVAVSGANEGLHE